MIRVLFDSVEISNDYIYELKRDYNLFEDKFLLGSVSAQTYSLTVDKEGVSNKAPSFVYIKDGNTNIATLQVDNLNEDDKLVYQYSLIDAMVNLEFNYDASPVVGQSGATLLRILQDICTKANLTLANSSFNGSDLVVTWYDNTLTAREYVGYIAELNGGYAVINPDGELELKSYSNTSVASIDINDCENFTLGEQHTITRVVYDDESGTFWEFGDDTGDTLYLDINNPYITSEAIAESIYSIIDGFSFYCLSVDNAPTVSGEVGNIITFVDGSVSYPTILQYEQKFGGDVFYGGYSLQIESSKQAETRVKSTKQMVKSIKTTVDRDLGQFQRDITQVTTDVDSVKKSVTTVQQSIDKITTTVTDTQTSLENYATKDELAQTSSSLSTSISQTAENITLNINSINNTVTEQGNQLTELNSYFDFTSSGLTIGKSDSEVKLALENDELSFNDNTNKLAWLDSSDGLGASALSIGDANTQANRWRIFTRGNGSHLTFTRHN